MTINTPLISVIVPIYKVEKYLRRCVESIIAQSYRNLEVILVDDGSPDRCPAMCDEYAIKDNRIKVIHQSNGGLAAARNSGLEIAKGSFVAFVDSDDVIHCDYISILLSALQDSEADIAIAKFQKFSTDNVCMNVIQDVSQKKISLYESLRSYCSLQSEDCATFISCCNKLYRKKLFETLRFPIGKLNEDSFVSYRLLVYAENGIVLVDKPLYYYYIRNNSIVGSGFSFRNLDVLDAYHEAIEWFRSLGKDDFGYFFYPPLLMREIYCWWGCLYKMKSPHKAAEVLEQYRKDCGFLSKVKTVTLKWKCIFVIIAKCPLIYTLYRKFSPVYMGDR